MARTDLKMSPGKLAAQVGHAVQLAIRNAETREASSLLLREWEKGSYAKVVLGMKSLEEMSALGFDLMTRGYPFVVVEDEGRTEITGKNQTCLALIPLRKSNAFKMVGHLRLYR